MKTRIPSTLQFFAEPAAPAAPADPTPAPAPAPTSNPPAPAAPPMNFDEMIKGDKAFQSWLDGRVTAATATAVTTAQEKWQKAQDANLSEAEKLKNMTADEKAAHYEKKYQDEIASRRRMENASAMEKQTAAMFAESGIPAALLETIDFQSMTADGVKARVALLSGFEFHKKGEFDTAVKAALDAKLKQPSPETHIGNEKGATDMRSAIAERYGK